MRQNINLLAFNRGLVSNLGMARADIKRMAMSAAIMTNWICRVLGSMMLRPGTGYIGQPLAAAAARYLPFIFSSSDKALIEMTAANMRAWITDVVLTRAAVTAAVVGGTFPSAASLAANWTDADEAGATSAWLAAGAVTFVGTGTNAAIRRQTVAVVQQGTEHALRVVVTNGPITIRVGTAAGLDDYITETALGTGTHSLAFTPTTANFYIEFNSRLQRTITLAQCDVEAAGAVTLPTPYAVGDLGYLRFDQSGDIVYLACRGYQQRKIERRGTGRSFSVVLYQPTDGPFRTANVSVLTLTPSVLTGNGTLTASLPFFRTTHAGALFAVTSTGQVVTKNIGALNDATASIRVTGVTPDRAITIVISALTATGDTVILERSFDDVNWVAVPTYTWTVDVTDAYADGLDNQIVYYRLRCSVYAGGAPVATLNIATGSVRGVCRLTTYSSATVFNMEVLTAFGGTAATDDWEEGLWSPYRGWPSAVRFFGGRIFWAGKDKVVGSISDGYESFDPTIEGDAGVINRNIGSGPVDSINFMIALQRLILGGQGAEYSCRSSALDEPLTPTNFNIKKPSRQGSSSVCDGIEIDNRGIYVQRGGIRVFELSFGSAQDPYTYDYSSTQLSQLIPTIGHPGIVRLAAQRQPDTRIHFVRSDGTVAILVIDSTENVACWQNFTAGGEGFVEDAVVLPGDEGEQEDHVYYVVKRTINGAVVRYLERWATEAQAKGDQQLCMLADAYITYTGAPATVIAGLGTLEGKNVAVWADGTDVGSVDHADGTITYTYTVAGGQIVLAAAASNVVVGLPYIAPWKSAKLVQIQSAIGSALDDMQAGYALGVILADTHTKGLRFGPDLDSMANMDNMPSIEDGAPVNPDWVFADYDGDPFPFPGKWSNDSRLCLQAQSPRPVTMLAAIFDVKSND